MTKKRIFILVACLIVVFFLGWAFGSTKTVLHSTSSLHYKVEIMQERFFIEHAAYLSASYGDTPIVKWKLLYTGDFLDGDFRSVYPNYVWDSESILRIGNNVQADDHFNDIQITNESASSIAYLLIETYADKIVLLGIEPHSSTSVKFPFDEQLSCVGEFAKSKKKFSYAVRSLEKTQKSSHIEIKLKDGNVNIESSELKLEPTNCCSPDRPVEWFY